MVTFKELVRGTDRAWFDPSSGWCVLDGGEVVYLKNPSLLSEHELNASFADGLRESLTTNRVSPILEAANRTLDDQLESVLNGIRENRFHSGDSIGSLLGLDDPSQLWIEVQGSCNEECIHCYAESAPADLPSLEQSTVRSIIEDAEAAGFSLIQFTGGDPLLWDGLVEMVHETRDRGMTPEIYTNGLLLDETLYRDLLPADPHFAFSLYSHEASVHDTITQHDGSWERTVEAIERAASGPTETRVGVVIMDQNRGQEDQIVAFLDDLGIDPDRINLSYLQTVGRGRQQAKNGSASKTNGSNNSNGQAGTNGYSSSKTQSDSGHLSGEKRSFNPGKICVSYAGSVIPCIFQRDVSLGNIHKRSFESILDDPSVGYTVSAAGDDNPEPGGVDELSCAECRFHSFTLNYLLQSVVKQPTS
ncbi:MAG: radical SAM/SPASM domain-containing protein [bacterium]